MHEDWTLGGAEAGGGSHRVVKKNGEIAEAFAFGGANVQRDLLLNEGVIFIDDKTVDMEKCVCSITEISL